MTLPIRYNIRNVFVRWRATMATIIGVALVVAVYILIQSLAVGLEKSGRNTGDPRNLMIVRKGSTAESSSQVNRTQLKTLQYLPQIERDAQGQPLISADLVVLISLPRQDGKGEANVTMRGISRAGVELRPQVTLVEGRWFVPGGREVVVSTKMAKRFAQCAIGDRFRTGGHELHVVGHFDGGETAFDSEIWMDADEARSVFDRENYSSALVRMRSPEAAQEFMKRIEADKRLPLRVDPEIAYYSEQTRTSQIFQVIGTFLAVSMSIGAFFAAMNTMYASVGARTREIGTLRVLGFRRRTILASFILEGAILAAIGGAIGCLISLGLQSLSVFLGWQFGTMSFNTFSEVVFQFRITPGLAAQGMVFAVVVGVLGSFFPAVRASRLPVIAALKVV
ncbi:MAG TPA: ABC transporter permease [Verrucomicrobiae bacterium]|nr:ABC transporter permease [Verrucomicrobiae bacterium]